MQVFLRCKGEMDSGEAGRGLSVAALGRSFSLGMLYDSRNEQLLSGITLWDQATLAKRTVTPQETCDFAILCSDTLDEKASALEVSGSLKLSCMGGLVNLEGAGKYLQNTKTSVQQERVTLQYKCTTRTETLTMETLGEGRVQHPGVFDHGTATHVVTGITYGAQAFFVFDRHHDHSLTDWKGNIGIRGSKQGKQAEGSLASMVEKIPSIKLSGEFKLDMSDDEKKKTEKFTCRFFGDFLLPQNPYSYEDAVRMYQELPKLLGTEGKKAVPVKVDLYPLYLIDNKATRLVRDISIVLISETERFFEEMHGFHIRCNDLLNTDAAKRFSAIQDHIEEFQKLTETYKRVVQKELCELLPHIRGGGREETCLADLLNKASQSPLSSRALRSWLKTKEADIKVLSKHTQALADIQYATDPGDLDSVILDPDNTYCLCLTFTMPSHDSQLEKMRRHCFETQATISSDRAAGDASASPNATTKFSLTEVARAFRNFCHANRNTKGVCFLAAQEFSECNALAARVDYYQDGRLISKDYELPSVPEGVQEVAEDATHDSITVSWSPPQYGASTIKSYVVSCGLVAEVVVGHEHSQATVAGLTANTEYEVRLWSKCRLWDGPAAEAVTVKTRPASPPETLSIQKVSPTTVRLRWHAPASLAAGCSVEHYIIEQETSAGNWKERERTSPEELTCTVTVESSTVHRFRVAASCGATGRSRDSEPVTVDLTKPAPEDLESEDLKRYVCANSRSEESNPHIYVLDLKTVSSNSTDMINKLEFGDRKPGVPEKVIMVVGATGSGKTTLVNGFVNFVFGVEWKDPFRFKMIVEPNAGDQTRSQTTWISSYTLHHSEGFRVPYTLTIVDTPGFGDVRGIERDKEITESIRKFFTSPGMHNVTHIDAIGFVANSSLPRLTPTQNYVFHQILSLFGKDIAKNIFLLLTFADGKEPQVLSAVNKAAVPYEKYFKFNNSALYASQSNNPEPQTRAKRHILQATSQSHRPGDTYHKPQATNLIHKAQATCHKPQATSQSQVLQSISYKSQTPSLSHKPKPQVTYAVNKGDVSCEKQNALYAGLGSTDRQSAGNDGCESANFDTMFWEMGLQSFRSFNQQLNLVESKSLVLTQHVLTERSRLQVYVSGIQIEIREGLSILQRLEKERDVLQNHRADIDRNKDFEYEVEEEVFVKEDIPPGQYITNCLKCNRTCHEVCAIAEDSKKMGCAAMKDGYCCICPKKCLWSDHGNYPYKYVSQKKKIKKTVKELRERYEKANQKKLTAENIIEEITGEFIAKKVEVLGLADCVRKCLQRLDEIALRPNPLSTVEYIETLMEAEKSQGEPGWQKRLEQLRFVKEEAEHMQKIAVEGFDPFQHYAEHVGEKKGLKEKITCGLRKLNKYIFQ